MRVARIGIALLVAVLPWGCSDVGGRCTEGRQVSCDCADARKGIQVCGDDGSFGKCSCDSATGGSTHGGQAGVGGKPSAGTSAGGGGSTAASSSGGAEKGGTSAAGSTSGQARCAQPGFCDAYCAVTSEKCDAELLTKSECAAACQQKCEQAGNCSGKYSDYVECVTKGGSQCVSDMSTSLGDCREKYDTYATCMRLWWGCQDRSSYCLCRHNASPQGESCVTPLACCLHSLSGDTCNCFDRSDCSSPGYVRVPACPP